VVVDVRKRPRLVIVAVTMSIVAASCTSRTPNAFDAHGPGARHTADLAIILFSIAGGVWIIVTALIVFGSLVRRRTNLFRSSDGRFITVGGVVLPGIVLAVAGALTIHYTSILHDAGNAADPMRIEVVGHQWWWEVRYTDLGFVTANDMHVPIGKPIDITLTSADVIHSFWVPQIAAKVDAIPGDINRIHLVADNTGVYWGPCAEFCGLQHANMSVELIAQSPADFDAWANAHDKSGGQPGASDLIDRGRAVFFSQPCAGCHRIAGTEAVGTIGPDLSDVGTRLRIGGGVLENTHDNLIRWITNPPAVKPGVLMPAFPLPPGDVDALVSYLESLDG
jgi:cytochrome c oxidase subunit 2